MALGHSSVRVVYWNLVLPRLDWMLLKAEPALTGLLDFPPCALTLPLIRCSSFNVGSARLLLSFYFLFDWVLLNVWLGSLGFSTWNTAFGLLTNNFPPRIICCSFLFSFSSVICFFFLIFYGWPPSLFAVNFPRFRPIASVESSLLPSTCRP